MWKFAIFFDREHLTFEKLHYNFFHIQYTFLCGNGWIFISYSVFVTKINVKTLRELEGKKDEVTIKLLKENIATSKQMLICLLSGDTNPNPASVSVDPALRQAQKIKHKCMIYTFTFYSFCSEIAGSIISLITLLDMMHQKFIVYRNTLNRTQGFTMDTRLTVLPIALTTVNDSFKIFCFSFFFWLFLFF